MRVLLVSYPISESATKVDIVFAKNSGMVVAVAIKVEAMKKSAKVRLL